MSKWFQAAVASVHPTTGAMVPRHPKPSLRKISNKHPLFSGRHLTASTGHADDQCDGNFWWEKFTPADCSRNQHKGGLPLTMKTPCHFPKRAGRRQNPRETTAEGHCWQTKPMPIVRRLPGRLLAIIRIANRRTVPAIDESALGDTESDSTIAWRKRSR